MCGDAFDIYPAVSLLRVWLKMMLKLPSIYCPAHVPCSACVERLQLMKRLLLWMFTEGFVVGFWG